ncbi:MAG TPA: hypothetical protein VFR58_16215 [Flavisolibacter sp.]|nr:hypothetical protein [Flavisolibacter sp.]
MASKGGSSSGRSGGGNSSSTQYQGSDISTGTQTPENITTPNTTDIFDSGMSGGGSDNNDNA